MGNISVKWTPSGGMDMDTAFPLIKANSYVDAWHIRVQADRDGNGGKGRKLGGTLEIPWTAPQGVNTGMGTYTDPRRDNIVVFVHNDQGNHSIIWHHPKEGSARTVTIPTLNFTPTSFVTGAAMFDGHLLAFTDGENPIRFIDMAKADDTGKKSSVRIYLPPYTDGLVTRSLVARLVTDGIPAPIYTPIATATGEDVFDAVPSLRVFADGLETNLIAPQLSADPCSGMIEVEFLVVGNHTIEAQVIDNFGSSSTTTQCLVEHWNRYNSTWDQWQVNLATVVPVLAPDVSSRHDPKYPGGQVAGRAWQFCVAYRYKDNRRSNTGPISDVVVPSLSVCGAATQPNTIDIDLSNDGWLDFPPVRGEIEEVNIHVRENDGGAWQLFKSIPKSEWAHKRVFQFRNDTTNPWSDSAFVNTPANSLPHTALALCGGADKDNNQRLTIWNMEEGDEPPCAEVEAHVGFEGNLLGQATTGTITGRVRIYLHDSSQPLHIQNRQPIMALQQNARPFYGGMRSGSYRDQSSVGQGFGQNVNGFAIYAVGTDIVAITEQYVQASGTPSLAFIGGTTVLDGTSPARRTAIRNAMANGDIYSTFTLSGLEPGRYYVLRMASSRVSSLKDGDSGFGGIYDLSDPNRKYQTKTFGRTVKFGDTGGFVDADTFECTVRIPPGGGTVDIGEIVVADCPTTVAHEVWALDRDGIDHSSTEDLRDYGYPAHLQSIITDLHLPSGNVYTTGISTYPYLESMNLQGKVWTNHNGMAFIFGLTAGSPYSVGWEANGTTPNSYAQNKWEGAFDAPAAALVTATGLSGSAGFHMYLVPNLNPISHERMMTDVIARYVNAQGSPVQGVLVVMERGGFFTTDATGTVSIPAYVDMTGPGDERRDHLIAGPTGGCAMSFTPGARAFFDIYLYSLGPGGWSAFRSFTMPDTIVDVTAQSMLRGLARGGTYPFGYYLKRADGSRTPVKPLGDLVIPMHGQDLHLIDPYRYPAPLTFDNGLAVINWAVSGAVPIPKHGRFVSLHFVIGEDARKNTMLQWVAGQVVYATEYNETDSKPEAAPSPAQASEVYIDIGSGLARKRLTTTGFLPGWSFEKGDRLRVITDNNGVPLQRVVDMEVTGQRGIWVVARHSSADPVLRGGEHIELVRPGNTQTETGGRVYHDVAGWHVLINDPYGTPAWAALSGTLRGGDTWMLPTEAPWRTADTRPWTVRRVVRESRHPTDFTDDKSWGKGKVWLADPAQTDTRYGMKGRFSNVYRGNSQVNGLNLFNDQDHRTTDHDLGSVQVAVSNGDVIACVCERGWVSFYKTRQPINVGEDYRMEVAGAFLASYHVSKAKVGCVHRMSVAMSPRGSVFFYDHRNGWMVQQASNEPEDISGQFGAGAFFQQRAYTMPEPTRVCAGFDPSTGEVLVTFHGHVADDGYQQYDVDGQTILYHDRSNTYVCKALEAPDCWASSSASLWAFENGKLWRVGHPSAPLNHRFGVQRDLSVTFMAGNVLQVTTPLSIKVWRDGGWDVPVVRNENGQTSFIPPEKIVPGGGRIALAKFMKDTSEPGDRMASHGQELFATSHLITLSHPGPDECGLIVASLVLDVQEEV